MEEAPDYMAQLQTSPEVLNDWDQSRRQVSQDQLNIATLPGGFVTPPQTMI